MPSPPFFDNAVFFSTMPWFFKISQRFIFIFWPCDVFLFPTCRDIYFVWVAFFSNMPWLYFHLYNIFFDQAAFFFDHSATYFWLCCEIIFERAPICFWITPCFFDFASFFSTKHQTTFDHAVIFLKHSAIYLKIPWRIF